MAGLGKKAAIITAGDVRECIRRHHGPNGEKYAVLFEVRNGAAWSANRSVDAVVMSLWPSLGLELHGMEIKVSRGDWLRELENPEKASDVIRHFDRWWLIAPDHVAKPDELPEPWGWMTPKGDKLVTIKKAPLNKKVATLDRSFLSVLLRLTSRRDGSEFSTALEARMKEQQRDFNSKIEVEVMKRIGELKPEAEAWRKLRDLLKEKPDDYISQPDVIAALRVLMKAGVLETYGGLHRLMGAVESMHKTLSELSDQFTVEKRK